MKVGIIGGGSWGATLANLLSDNGHQTLIYDINQAQIDGINNEHKHPLFDCLINEDIKGTTNLEEVVSFSNVLLISVPTKVMRPVLANVKGLAKEPKIFINVSKGIEPETLKTVSQIAEEIFDKDTMEAFVTLSGPSHAEEVILRKLTLLVAACKDEKYAKFTQELFSNSKYMRVYTSQDILGVEIGGSVKNAIALVSGVATGLGLGENARAALISRGALEVIRVVEALGGKKETVFGLTGIGDLIVTASSMNSRNFQAGLKIGEGQDINEVVNNSRMVVEGARVIISCHEIKEKYQLELPIIEASYQVLYGGHDISKVVPELLTRALKEESIPID